MTVSSASLGALYTQTGPEGRAQALLLQAARTINHLVKKQEPTRLRGQMREKFLEADVDCSDLELSPGHWLENPWCSGRGQCCWEWPCDNTLTKMLVTLKVTPLRSPINHEAWIAARGGQVPPSDTDARPVRPCMDTEKLYLGVECALLRCLSQPVLDLSGGPILH